MARGYTSVSIPDGLLAEIDELLERRELGYVSRSEFVKEALRSHLLRIENRDRIDAGGGES